MSKTILHTDEILNILYICITFAKLWGPKSCECGCAWQHHLLVCGASASFFVLTFLTVPALLLTAGFFLTYYSSGYTAECEWHGGTNPAERTKGKGKEKQVKGCLSQCR